jgi:hypothetical protein
MILLLLLLLIVIFKFLCYFFENTSNEYVCLYAYYEKDEQYKENFKIFLETAILDNVDYYIIINGKCTLDLPKKTNINILYRENKGYDFGAWSYCIKNYINKKYDYYIFLNTSVRGPYLDKKKNWLNEFLKLFNTPDVKLVGTTINILTNYLDYDLFKEYSKEPPYSHIQSMFFILNSEGYDYLMSLDFFNEEIINNYTMNELIINKEIKLSQYIITNNWNINCILKKYKDNDYRKVKHNFNTHGDDPYYINAYFGETIKPEEVIFFKTNRF